MLRRVDSRGEPQQHRHKHRSERSIGGERQLLRRNSRSETPTQHHVHYPQTSSSSVPPGSRYEERPASATSQRRLQRIIEATQPSPAPPSYERARPYLPPPLPPGYKVGVHFLALLPILFDFLFSVLHLLNMDINKSPPDPLHHNNLEILDV